MCWQRAKVVVLLALLVAAAEAQPKYELRAAWIATVINLDWPDRDAHPVAPVSYTHLTLPTIYSV